MNELPLELIRECFEYDSKTGSITWKVRPARHFNGDEVKAKQVNTRLAGKAVTSVTTKGYVCAYLNGVQLMSHRLAWVLTYGVWPKHQMDHVNGDPGDNRLANLRLVTQSENSRNVGIGLFSGTGVHGVNLCSHDSSKYRVRFNGKSLGTFTDFQEAVAVRRKAERENGYHPNHGRRDSYALRQSQKQRREVCTN